MKYYNLIMAITSAINIFLGVYWITDNHIASIAFAFALLGYRLSIDN